MSESESTYKIQGSRVYGQGMSINCTNKVTAEKLHNTLNTYELQIEDLESQIQTTRNIKDINKQLKAVLMDLEVLKHDITILKDKLE